MESTISKCKIKAFWFEGQTLCHIFNGNYRPRIHLGVPQRFCVFLCVVKVIVIGSGNLAWNLIEVFEKSPDIQLIQVLGRSTENLEMLSCSCPTTTVWEDLMEADLYLLAVTDQAIKSLGHKALSKGLWAHCSGSVGLQELPASIRRGVFYPLQSFTKGKRTSFSDLPIGIEAENEEDYHLLERLGSSLSQTVFRMDSSQRRVLHLAAVFINNFSNHMIARAEDIATEAGIDARLLYPLLEETLAKAKAIGAKQAQTGPARRADQTTLDTHLDLLKTEDEKKLYQAISQSIAAYYKKG